MKRTNLFIVALAIGMVACNSGKTTDESIVTLQEEKLPPLQQLQLEKIDLPEDYTMGMHVCYVYQDSVLIVAKDNNPYPLKKMVTLVNLNNGSIIGEYFSFGRGPGELFNIFTQLSLNYLGLLSYETKRFVPFNLDSAIMLGNAYKPNIINFDRYYFTGFSAIDDTSFMSSNFYYYDGSLPDCEANANMPEFYQFTKSGRCIPEFKESDINGAVWMDHVSREYLSVNKQKNRVACFSAYRPYAKVFDLDLNLVRRINGPEPDDGIYTLDAGIGMWWNKGYGRNQYYFIPTSDDENIIVVNWRTHLKWSPKLMDKNSEIFRFDWDGNLIGRYKVKDRKIYGYPTYSSSSNTMYLWLQEEDGECRMYKAKL